MDKLHKIGALGLASRLKRLSELLSKDVSAVYKKEKIDFEARWFPVVYYLLDAGEAKITEIAAELGITHTAINQLASELMAKGYIKTGRNKLDERSRLLSLTGKGMKICSELAPLWKTIKKENEKLIAEAGGGLLKELDRIESALAAQSMYRRIIYSLTGSSAGEIEIAPYEAKFKKHFARLNREWLNEYFEIEEQDELMLNHPKEKIINKGGAILFALAEGEVVGTCAIIKHKGNIFELAKMGVTKKFRGQKIGAKLLESAIDKAIQLGAVELYLRTNSRLKEANRLYMKRGFEKTRVNPFGSNSYRRETYAMKIVISKT